MVNERDRMIDRYFDEGMSPGERQELLRNAQADPGLARALAAEQMIRSSARRDMAAAGGSRERFVTMLTAVSAEIESGAGADGPMSPSSTMHLAKTGTLARLLPWVGGGAVVVALAVVVAPRFFEQTPIHQVAPPAATQPAAIQPAPAVQPAVAPQPEVPGVATGDAAAEPSISSDRAGENGSRRQSAVASQAKTRRAAASTAPRAERRNGDANAPDPVVKEGQATGKVHKSHPKVNP